LGPFSMWSVVTMQPRLIVCLEVHLIYLLVDKRSVLCFSVW
jgi:hypothetical protein